MDHTDQPGLRQNKKSASDYSDLTDMQSLVLNLLTDLVHCPPLKVRSSISDALRRLGEFVRADRAYIFEFKSREVLRNTHEWCAPGIEPEIDTLQDLSRDVIAFWLEVLVDGQPVYIPDVAALDEERSVTRDVLERQNIKSLLVVPMLDAGRLLGFVGFDAVRAHREFTDGEVTLLRSVANLICSTLQRAKMAQQVAKAEADLRLQKDRFRIIADTVSDVLWDHDFENKTWWMNKGWPEKLGMVAQASDGDPYSWFARVHPDDREKLRTSFHDLLRSRSGTWEVNYRVVGDDGKALDILVKATAIRNSDGRVSRMLGNARNITQEKRTQEGYSRARALETVGQLTGGIAHDFNNLLMIILGNIDLLEAGALSEEDAETVALISHAAESAATLTRQLLTFAQQDKLNVTRVDVETLMTDTISLLRSGLPEAVILRQTVPPDVWDVHADPNGLQQAVINLAMNSNDAMPRGGEIVLSCANLEIDAEMAQKPVDLQPGRYVVISVADTGNGMPPAALARAFEPFFTTKDVGKGTGLGLSTVHGFANQSGGATSIVSEPDCGTKVSIYLPADNGPAEQASEPDRWEDIPLEADHKRILVVEDEPQVRAYVEKTLARFGYEVTTAPDAASALEIARGGKKFDLLFTDIMMPGGMNGHELGQAVRDLDPHIKILYTSGYPAAAFDDIQMEEWSDINFLDKPYRNQKLKEKLLLIFS